MSSQPSTPDTIVLLHGFWVTPRSWEHWIDHYQARGFRVLAPAYPGFEVEVEALNADPSPIGNAMGVTVRPKALRRASTVWPKDAFSRSMRLMTKTRGRSMSSAA